jgi:hypothetical protein
MRSTIRILVAAAVLGLAPATFAQDTSSTASGDLAQTSAGQDQVIRDLLQRLDAQDAVNAELRRRVTALEALLPPSSSSTTPSLSPLDLAAVEETDRHLEERLDALPKITGYYDFEFFKDGLPGTFNEFRLHHMFLDFFKEYQKFRVMSEIEFEFATHMTAGPGGPSKGDRGELSLEQTWAEYVASNALTVRAGFILTPNYWNVNHYANVTASTQIPLMVRNVFPESFVGVMGYGAKYWGNLGIGYTAQVGNGEGAQFGERDDNSSKAVGGSLKFTLPTRGALDTFKLNVLGYVDTPAHQKQTRTWGLESQAQRGPFELLFELARRRAAEDRSGEYVQPSYRLTDKLMAFYRYDRFFVAGEGTRHSNTWGVSLHPIAPVALKFEFFRSRQPNGLSFNGVASSLAVAF